LTNSDDSPSRKFEDEDFYKHFTGLPTGESDRQLMLRALAIQSLCYPGFEYACREITKKLEGEKMHDNFRILLEHQFDTFEMWGLDVTGELG